jgi:hypothetical protein
MSKRINVNPDHYKIGGRERPGDAIARERKSTASDADKVRQRWLRQRAKGAGPKTGKK